MVPRIQKERCAAEPAICPSLQQCPTRAFAYVEDEEEPIGGRMVIDLSRCSGCGQCVRVCCGHCIVTE